MASKIDWEDVMCEVYVTFKENKISDKLKKYVLAPMHQLKSYIYYKVIYMPKTFQKNLKMMYREAVFGSNEKMKKHMKHSISNMSRKYK